MRDLRLYFHIPFCKQRCTYCDFVTFDDKAYLFENYFKALNKETALYGGKIADAKINSIFFGGGTPSYPPSFLIKGTLEKIGFDESAEISIEANPGTINSDKLNGYREMGINRISIGVQSFNNDILTVMGRIHDRAVAIRNIKEAQKAGFDNVGIDLMFGYPMQTREIFRESLQIAVDSGVKHISCYSLKVEEGTCLAGMLKKGVLREIGEEADREMYEDAKSILADNGFIQYEISNFAKPGYECRHNMGYWKLDEYIGLGAAAHSYYGGRRYSNTEDPGEYIRRVNKYEIPEIHSETIDERESMKEFIILGLRLTRGIEASEFKKKYKKNIYTIYGREIRECIAEGLLEAENGIIKLTKEGMDLANRVFIRFI